MIDLEAQRLREDYLTRLDAAIADLPWRLANELRTGILEELDGLGAEAMRERIRRLGEPERVAAAARAEADSAPAPVVVVASSPPPAPKPAMVDTKGFAVVGALALGLGGFLLPFVGWVIGIGLVTSSRFWRRWEKTVAILLPLGGWALLYAASLVAKLIWVQSPDGGASNPLVPTAYDLAHSSLFIALFLVPVGAAWLLWRLRGRDRPLR